LAVAGDPVVEAIVIVKVVVRYPVLVGAFFGVRALEVAFAGDALVNRLAYPKIVVTLLVLAAVGVV